MKVPTGNFLAANPKNQAIIQEAIISASKALEIQLTEIKVTFPAMLDDFDMMKSKIFWNALMTGMPEDWKGQPRIGGRLFWPDVPPPEVITLSVKRSASFAILIGLLPERQFVYAALDAYRFDNQYLLVGAYKMECAHLMDKALDEQFQEHVKQQNKQNGDYERWKPKLPSILKVQSAVVESMQKKSVEWLQDIHKKMAADIKREANSK